jgi:hypothetical protein
MRYTEPVDGFRLAYDRAGPAGRAPGRRAAARLAG